MSALDVLLLILIIAATIWWIAGARHGRMFLAVAPLLIAALAGIQLLIEGFYWQFIPAYGLIAILAALSLFSRGPPKGILALLGRIVLGGAALLAMAPFLVLTPVPDLPRPTGPYAVGTHIYRWVDENRAEPGTPQLDDKRNVVAQAWYPAEAGRGPHPPYMPPYMDGLDHLPDMVSVFPGFLLRSYGRIDTHAVLDAPPAGAKAAWPVIIFSPGYGASRSFYTGLLTDLASRGYVVLALDHPFEAPVTQLADGRVVGDSGDFARHAGSRESEFAWMAGQQDVRAADIGFVVSQLSSPAIGLLAGRLDLSHVAAIGHSFGGASSARALDLDPRLAAAANIDGTLYGDVMQHALTRPFLLLESDHVETGHSEQNLADNARLLANSKAPAWRYEIGRANHYSFTDAPLFFAPPGRFAVSLLIGGGRGPVETQHAAADILDAFLSGTDTEAAARKHSDIKGGAAK